MSHATCPTWLLRFNWKCRLWLKISHKDQLQNGHFLLMFVIIQTYKFFFWRNVLLWWLLWLSFYPPSNMPRVISIGIKNHMNIKCGKKCSCIMFDYHLKIVNQVLYLRLSWCPPLQCTLKYVEKDKNRLSCNILCLMHCCPHKYSYSQKCNIRVFLERFLNFVFYRLSNQMLFFCGKTLFKIIANEQLIMLGIIKVFWVHLCIMCCMFK
jgi:hypothetical protein